MGELTALTSLHINAPLSTVPLSMRSLTALRELTLDANGYFSADHGDPQIALFTDLSFCLPALCNLRKLRLAAPKSSSLAQRENDTLAIGLALRSWPMPFLDLTKTNFPGMRLYGDMYNNTRKHDPFAFKLLWRMLGLPAEAAKWDDVRILEHWRAQPPKTLAFASATHKRLGQVSPCANFPDIAMLMVTNELSGWDDLRAKDRSRQPQRIEERRQSCARRAKYFIDNESEKRETEEDIRLDRLQMQPPPEPIRSYELQVDQARRQQRLEIAARIAQLQADSVVALV